MRTTASDVGRQQETAKAFDLKRIFAVSGSTEVQGPTPPPDSRTNQEEIVRINVGSSQIVNVVLFL